MAGDGRVPVPRRLRGTRLRGPKDSPDAAWLPKAVWENALTKTERPRLVPGPPSAFPELALPTPDPNEPKEKASEKYDAAFARMCPRLAGKTVLAIEPSDDTLRKLLKARLHQGILEIQSLVQPRALVCFDSGPGEDFLRLQACLADMRAAATELWADQPKELVPWLQEFVVLTKEVERKARARVEIGSLHIKNLHQISRQRLRLEAELWKVKHPK